jgi:hypothetical protein
MLLYTRLTFHDEFSFLAPFLPSVLADFTPLGSGSAFRMRVRIRIHEANRVRIHCGSGSKTLDSGIEAKSLHSTCFKIDKTFLKILTKV